MSICHALDCDANVYSIQIQVIYGLNVCVPSKIPLLKSHHQGSIIWR
jgi:hypothetical protein